MIASAAGETGWGIVGASLRSPETRDALAPQDGSTRWRCVAATARQLRVIGSILSLLVAPEDPDALLAALADPRIRIVTLTVTEKAYLRDAAGDLDVDASRTSSGDLAQSRQAEDRASAFSPKRLHGAGRRGTPPFTVLCCDNLPANGATLRRLLLAFRYACAMPNSAALRRSDEVAFPSTMVDRIVPATTDEDRARISEALGVETPGR